MPLKSALPASLLMLGVIACSQAPSPSPPPSTAGPGQTLLVDGSDDGGAIDPKALQEWGGDVSRALNQARFYPASAQARRLSGVGVLFLSVAADGSIVSFALRERTGHRELDAAILAVPLRIEKLPPPPDGLAREEPASIQVPIRFGYRPPELIQ